MSASEKKPKLEKICPVCKGKCGETELGEFYPCDECNGAGYVPTETGKAILDLMRHNLKWMAKRELSA
jgi:DnaJ-class molecular chaperone